MKVSKEQVAQNREALIQAAARMFCEHGIDGVGVAEVCQRAGLTHGALYAQFASKEALAAEAFAEGAARGNARMTARLGERAATLTDHLDYYLSRQHRDNLGGGCAMAASASEIARQGKAVSVSFADGFSQLVGIIEGTLPGRSAADRHQRALAIVAAMIGGVAAARATAKASPALSEDILVAVRELLGQAGGEAKPRRNRARAPRRGQE
jgi:TetR/AcrR family transcriptional repressor of nem operon